MLLHPWSLGKTYPGNQTRPFCSLPCRVRQDGGVRLRQKLAGGGENGWNEAWPQSVGEGVVSLLCPLPSQERFVLSHPETGRPYNCRT